MAIWTQLAIAVAILSLYRRLRTQRLRDHNSPELEELQQLAARSPGCLRNRQGYGTTSSGGSGMCTGGDGDVSNADGLTGHPPRPLACQVWPRDAYSQI